MKMRRLVWLVVPAILAAGLFVFLGWTAPRINRAAFEEIQSGMTRAEVEHLLNCPGRKWRSLTAQKRGAYPDIVVEWLDPTRVPEHHSIRHYAWLTDELLITVLFDADDRVMEKAAFTGSFDAGVLARVRRVIRSWFW